MQKHLIILFLILLSGTTLFATESAFRGALEPGPHAVGFQILPRFDYGRPYKLKTDYDGNKISGERARPIQINVWYPAENSGQPGMPLSEYVHLTSIEETPGELTDQGKQQSENSFLKARWFQGYPEDGLKELLQKQTAAIRNGRPADGKYPLIVIANSTGIAAPFGHFVLAEYLARHGYVVASIPTRGAQSPALDIRDTAVQMQDIQFTIAALHDHPAVDPDRLALVGFGWGGVATALLAMHNPDVDAMISLDSAPANKFGFSILFKSSFYQPNQFRIPLLHITNQEENPYAENSFFKGTKFSSAQYVKIKGLSAADFSSFAMIKALLPAKEGRPDVKSGYEALCVYVHQFLNATVKKEAAGKQYLQNKPEDNGLPAGLVSVEFKSAIKTPPTDQQFAEILRTKGIEKAAAIQHEFAALDPQFRIYDSDVLLGVAGEYAQARKFDEAIAVLKLCQEVYPDDSEIFDQMGYIYMNSGNKQLAVENFSKSLDLNPDNPETAAALKKLQES